MSASASLSQEDGSLTSLAQPPTAHDLGALALVRSRFLAKCNTYRQSYPVQQSSGHIMTISKYLRERTRMLLRVQQGEMSRA
jgi:hypothetical protein